MAVQAWRPWCGYSTSKKGLRMKGTTLKTLDPANITPLFEPPVYKTSPWCVLKMKLELSNTLSSIIFVNIDE